MGTHHHDPRCALDQVTQDGALALAGIQQDGVQRQDERCGQPVHEIADHLAIGTAENAVLMLEPHRVSAAFVDRMRRIGIGLRLVLREHARPLAIVVRLIAIVERPDVEACFGVKLADLFDDVGGESRNAAFARGESADDRNARSGHRGHRGKVEDAEWIVQAVGKQKRSVFERHRRSAGMRGDTGLTHQYRLCFRIAQMLFRKRSIFCAIAKGDGATPCFR